MKRSYLIFLGFLIFISCNSQRNASDWLIPSEEVFDGGPGKDGIPSIDNPQFSSVSGIQFLNDEDLVVGIINGPTVRAYPHPILDWHEIVNDEVGDLQVAITYCPLTGTAIGWDRNVNGTLTEFGVSGKLFNSNLIPYDRATDSYWSQIGLNCVNGEWLSTEIKTIPLIETSWKTWKALFPSSQILNTTTGFNRSYGEYPYQDYKTNHNRLFFPVDPLDTRLPAKDRVIAVLENNGAKAYRLALFGSDKVIEDTVGDKNIVVIGSQEKNLMLAFENSLGLENLTISFDQLPLIAVDADGNKLGVDGRIYAGPRTGQRLEPLNAFIGYWFSLGAFYPEIEIYE